MRRVREGDRLTLLRIDDYGTSGLFGAEYPEGDAKNPFAALMRNNLDSAKSSGSAGGSFGLGKAVAWNCSLLFTVLAASEPVDRPAGTDARPVRLIGKTELTWHELAGDRYAGPGWYSAREPRFSSVWTDHERLSSLQLDRRNVPEGVHPTERTGTSLLIVGFHDPAQQDEADGTQIVNRLAEAAARNFWPAMLHRQLRVVVEHAIDGDIAQQVEVRPETYVPSFCEAYEAYQDRVLPDEGENVGEVVRRTVPLTLMPTREGQTTVREVPEELTAEAHLVVRLADKQGAEDDALLDHVALVRGRRMVVKYLAQRNVLIGGFPFHGVLLAGAAAQDAPYALESEEFLRAAEPPAHDEWEYNSDLKAIYLQGTGARLKEFFQRVRETLREMVRRPEGDERIGPVELRRLLEARTQGPPGSTVMASLSAPHAHVEGNAWRVAARVKLVRKDARTLIRPRLRLEVESGRSLHLPWKRIEWTGVERHGEDDHGP
jgi:RNA polymerase primary sigma factor